MEQAIEVHITAPNREQAEIMARTLVEERLAACVNIVASVRSVYRWNGEIKVDDEVLCVVKTRSDLFAQLEQRVRALHPYDVPEVLAFAVAQGNDDYLEWLAGATAATPPPVKNDGGE